MYTVLEAALARRSPLAPLAALAVRPYCAPLLSALTVRPYCPPLMSALNVALNAALERKPRKIMHSRQTGKRPPKHSSGNTMGTLKGRPLWHRWSKATVLTVNGPWWWDFLNASTTPCSVGMATSMHPLKKLTTNPQNFSLRKTLFSDHKGSAATNGVNIWLSFKPRNNGTICKSHPMQKKNGNEIVNPNVEKKWKRKNKPWNHMNKGYMKRIKWWKREENRRCKIEREAQTKHLPKSQNWKIKNVIFPRFPRIENMKIKTMVAMKNNVRKKHLMRAKQCLTYIQSQNLGWVFACFNFFLRCGFHACKKSNFYLAINNILNMFVHTKVAFAHEHETRFVCTLCPCASMCFFRISFTCFEFSFSFSFNFFFKFCSCIFVFFFFQIL